MFLFSASKKVQSTWAKIFRQKNNRDLSLQMTKSSFPLPQHEDPSMYWVASSLQGKGRGSIQYRLHSFPWKVFMQKTSMVLTLRGSKTLKFSSEINRHDFAVYLLPYLTPFTRSYGLVWSHCPQRWWSHSFYVTDEQFCLPRKVSSHWCTKTAF